MKMTLLSAIQELWDVCDDMPVMSHEAQGIFANPKYRQQYIEAVERLKTEHEVTVVFDNGDEITLTR